MFRKTADDDIIELVHIVKVPDEAFNERSPCHYKYCVFSDAVKEFMRSSFEYIPGNTRDGRIINRLLVLNAQYINKAGKWLHSVYNFELCEYALAYSLSMKTLYDPESYYNALVLLP